MIKFVDAIVDRNLKKVAYFLGQGADPNSVIDASGLLAMHFACQPTVSIFKCLLDHGGSILIVMSMASQFWNIRRILRKYIV